MCAAAAVKDALQRKGLLPQLQANVRSQIFNVLLAAEVSLCTLNAANSTMYPSKSSRLLVAADVAPVFLQEGPRPEPCDETLIINELIREYLVWHGLRDTLSVFIPGTGWQCPGARQFAAAAATRHGRQIICGHNCLSRYTLR